MQSEPNRSFREGSVNGSLRRVIQTFALKKESSKEQYKPALRDNVPPVSPPVKTVILL